MIIAYRIISLTISKDVIVSKETKAHFSNESIIDGTIFVPP